MLLLALRNIADFVRNRFGIFFFFIFTLVIVSFSSIFLCNTIAQRFCQNYNTSAEYYIEFTEPQDVGTIKNELEKYFLYPSQSYYLDEKAAVYNWFINQPPSGGSTRYVVIMMGRLLEKGEEPGIFGYNLSSVYMNRKRQMEYGRALDKSDENTDNAVIACELRDRVENGQITLDGKAFDIVGCFQVSPSSYKNSISVSDKTFENLGYKVKALFLNFEIPPLKSGIVGFDSTFADVRSESNIATFASFSLDTAVSLLKDCAVYILVLAVVLFGVAGISENRTYSIYSLCGMSRSEKRLILGIEMLIFCFPER